MVMWSHALPLTLWVVMETAVLIDIFESFVEAHLKSFKLIFLCSFISLLAPAVWGGMLQHPWCSIIGQLRETIMHCNLYLLQVMVVPWRWVSTLPQTFLFLFYWLTPLKLNYNEAHDSILPSKHVSFAGFTNLASCIMWIHRSHNFNVQDRLGFRSYLNNNLSVYHGRNINYYE